MNRMLTLGLASVGLHIVILALILPSAPGNSTPVLPTPKKKEIQLKASRAAATLQRAKTQEGPTTQRGGSKSGMGRLSAGSPQGKALIRQTLVRHSGAFEQCYQRALKNKPGLSGSLTLAWTIHQGRVGTAQVLKSTLQNPSLHHCLSKELSRIPFPELRDGSELRFPFRFTP